ncbi:MAG: PilZ domain-containing protein [Nitrospiria bacterium]
MEKSRRFPRTEMVLRVDFRISGQKENREKTFTQIVGGGGLMATTPSLLPAGTIVDMNLYHDSFVIPFEAQVVWVDPAEKTDTREYKCGFQFITGSNSGLMHIQYLVQSKLNDQISNLP